MALESPYGALPPILPVRLKDEPIPAEYIWPHFMDTRFQVGVPRTVFLARDEQLVRPDFSTHDELDYQAGPYEKVIGLSYFNSKMLRRLVTKDAINDALAAAETVFPLSDTAAYFEAVLRRILGANDIDLRHLLVGMTGEEQFRQFTFGIRQAEPNPMFFVATPPANFVGPTE